MKEKDWRLERFFLKKKKIIISQHTAPAKQLVLRKHLTIVLAIIFF